MIWGSAAISVFYMVKNVPYETLLIEKYVYFDGEREIVEYGQTPTAALGFMDHIKVNTYPNILVGREFIFLAKLLILIM